MPPSVPCATPVHLNIKKNPNRAHLIKTGHIGLFESVLGPYHGHRYGLFSLGKQYTPSILATSLVDKDTLDKALDQAAQRILEDIKVAAR